MKQIAIGDRRRYPARPDANAMPPSTIARNSAFEFGTRIIAKMSTPIATPSPSDTNTHAVSGSCHAVPARVVAEVGGDEHEADHADDLVELTEQHVDAAAFVPRAVREAAELARRGHRGGRAEQDHVAPRRRILDVHAERDHQRAAAGGRDAERTERLDEDQVRGALRDAIEDADVELRADDEAEPAETEVQDRPQPADDVGVEDRRYRDGSRSRRARRTESPP